MERFLCAIALTIAVTFASGYMAQQLPSLHPLAPLPRVLGIPGI
jgi:hypothetical protein